jgi:predicted Zn-dependent protease
VAARVLLLAVAVTVCLWLAAGLRASQLQAEGERSFDADRIDLSEVEHRLELLDDAQRLNPDPTPEIRQAQLLVVADRDSEAVRVLEDVVEREPENYEAWLGLRQAALRVDPPLSRRATREALRLNPLARASRRDRQ